MSSADPAVSPVAEDFEAARKEFLANLGTTYKQKLDSTNSIDDVYDMTEQLQQAQSKTGSLRYLKRIQPYLEALERYAGIVDTFVQVKPDILGLIWVS